MPNNQVDPLSSFTEDELKVLIDNPDIWAETFLQDPTTPTQQLKLRWYQRNVLKDQSQRRVLRMGRRCVAAADTIYTPHGPYLFEDLLTEHPPIWTLNTDTYTIEETIDYDVSSNGEVETVKLETISGKRQQVSLDHPFLVYTNNGPNWIEAKDIQPGMRIAVPRGLIRKGTAHGIDKVAKIAKTLDSHSIYSALSCDVLWEPVKSVTPSGKTQTVDLHVHNTETFIGSDIISHNTGKTAVLGIIALFQAMTYKQRQVLIVAAYDAQVQEIFEQMLRMAEGSPLVGPSINRTRQRPFEIWFRNGSLVRGMVANNTVRGKCLASGTRVMVEAQQNKAIEELKPGELVMTVNMETGETEMKPVVALHNNGIREVFELSTTSDRIIRATEGHKFYLSHGRGWTELNDIVSAMESEDNADYVAINTVSTGLRFGRVNRIKIIGQLPTWDLEVEDNHNFVAFEPDMDPAKSGFSASGMADGGFLVHNSAHMLIMDEIDFADQKALMEAVWPVATTWRTTEVVMSSTPSGRREFFWKVCNNLKEYKFEEHHYPSSYSPEWTQQNEAFARGTTTKSQYDHEYLAEFGESAEGVYRHDLVDQAMYAYEYDQLEYNPNNYYTLGVDWNEASSGVQGVIMEWLIEPVKMYKYNPKMDKIDVKHTRVQHKWRIFRTFTIDAVDYTNITAIDEILDWMKKVPLAYACFDRGHGYTNYELLRVSIQRGVTASGKKCPGLIDMLPKMESVDFAVPFEIIDPTTNIPTKSKTKNVMVRNSVRYLEGNNMCIPAVALPADWPQSADIPQSYKIVENDQYRLIGQMRDYRVERIGDKGEVYSKGNDHRLDAWILGLHAFLLNKDLLMHWANAVHAEFASDNITPKSHINRAPGSPKKKGVSVKSSTSRDGVTHNYMGKYAGPGEPPDSETLPGRRKMSEHISRGAVRGRINKRRGL